MCRLAYEAHLGPPLITDPFNTLVISLSNIILNFTLVDSSPIVELNLKKKIYGTMPLDFKAIKSKVRDSSKLGKKTVCKIVMHGLLTYYGYYNPYYNFNTFRSWMGSNYSWVWIWAQTLQLNLVLMHVRHGRTPTLPVYIPSQSEHLIWRFSFSLCPCVIVQLVKLDLSHPTHLLFW